MSQLQLGYVIVFVEDVATSVAFFERAFGFTESFIHPAGDYGELRTGATRLAFTSHALAADAVPYAYVSTAPERRLGMELTLTTPDVDAAFAHAVAAGASPLSEPVDKPWGQRVAYVSTPDGIGVGIATPMG